MATAQTPSGNKAGLSELFTRLRFVLIAIIVYRIGTHIPVPGIDPKQLAALFNQNQGTILGLANMFSGGALERMSILALGIMPYIYIRIYHHAVDVGSDTPARAVEEGRRVWPPKNQSVHALSYCGISHYPGRRYDSRYGQSRHGI